MSEKPFNKTISAKVFDLWNEGVGAADAADILNLNFSYTNSLFKKWDSLDARHKKKVKGAIYEIPVQMYEDKSFLHKLSENQYKSPDYVLITTSDSVKLAEKAMECNRDTDIEM